MARFNASLPLTRLPIESVSTANRCQANVLPTASPISRAAGSRYASNHAGSVAAYGALALNITTNRTPTDSRRQALTNPPMNLTPDLTPHPTPHLTPDPTPHPTP